MTDGQALHGSGLMICGTASDVGKSHMVAGLCRLLARRGLRVAPFKAQNMALNSYVTASGHEIGRAQASQAMAARCEPEGAMNPILLKPTGEHTSQVIVNGRSVGHLSAAEYHDRKPELLGLVLTALEDLRQRFDVVIAEGAGSPSEINLLSHDIVNLRIAYEARLPALIVGDIDRGGVFAALYGTVALLPDEYRALVRGFIINKFRGDRALLGGGVEELERRSGISTLGVVPFVTGVALDAEDSLALSGHRPRATSIASGTKREVLDVAVVALPRMSNFTDFDALALEPGVSVRFVHHGGGLGQPDLVVLPGSKATALDLEWVRLEGLDRDLTRCHAAGTVVLGVCGGFQMLGCRIRDDIESGLGDIAGLGWLGADTTFLHEKVTRQRHGTALGQAISGYEIHHGRSAAHPGAQPWLDLGEGGEGIMSQDGSVFGTNLHGLFDEDGFRTAFLTHVANHRGKSYMTAGVDFAAARESQFDRLADLLETHLDIEALDDIMAEGVRG
jgi:adenosylcobyric acid synthase